jgi:hypothetical protein
MRRYKWKEEVIVFRGDNEEGNYLANKFLN